MKTISAHRLRMMLGEPMKPNKWIRQRMALRQILRRFNEDTSDGSI